MSVTTIQSSTAAVSDKCDGSFTENGTKVTSQHGKIFYIDSGQGQNVDASYVSYAVTNTSGETRKNIWVRLESFTGGVVQLANPADANTPIGDIANSSTGVAFTLLKAPTSSTKAQSHVVKVYSGNPNLSGATLRYTCTFTFNKVMETIKARANKVTSVTNTTASVVGSTFTITVQGDTGTMGAGNSLDGRSIWVSPASRSSWPTEAIRLESTNFSLYTTNGRNTLVSGYPKTNTLYFSIATQDKYYYTAVYTFRIIGLAGSSVSIKPVAQISSGTQMKHNDVSDTAISNTINLSTATVSMAITKDMSTTATYDASTQKLTFSYTISLVNSGAADQTVDLVTDTPATSLAYVASTAKFNNASIPDPSTSNSNSANLIFSGPFTVPANTTRTLTYKMVQRDACSSGSYSYSNSATATLGQLLIGSGAATYSLVVGNGTCANTTTTVTVTNPSLAPTAITNAPSSITTTGATFNATIDPNTQSGWTVTFEWGTTSSLTETAITLADTTTSTSVAYSVSTAKTGLSSGTTYYYRIKLSKTGSTTVYGEIVNFTTPELAANPTATTNNITNVSVSGSDVSVTFNGTIDPNQIANGVKVRFEYAPRVSSTSTACTGNIGTVYYAPSSSTYVQVEDTTNTTDLVLSGSFPTAVEYLNSSSSNVVVLDTGNSGGGAKFNTIYFCFRVVGLYNSTTANWITPVYGDWVPFVASNKTAQTISYTQPANMIVGATSSTATATATSGLAVTYESSDPTICTVDATTGLITAVSEGVCTLTATQVGNNSYYEATPVSVTFNITASAPTATTVAASLVTSSTATLNGTINGGGASTTTTFCYGTDSNLSGCTSITASQSPVTGSTNTSVSIGLTGLSGGTTYYFRVSGTNSQGSATGTILSFTTTVTVTYFGNSSTGGSVPIDLSSPYVAGSTVTVIGNTGSLVRGGYVFDRWNTNSLGTGTSYLAGATLTASTNIELYAKWTALTYSITYDANGGTGNTDPQSGSGDATVTLRSNGFSNGSKSFLGWSTSSGDSNTKTYDASEILNITSNTTLTLYAVWTNATTYTLTIVPATGGSATATAYSIISGQNVTINATANSGYRVTGWSCSMGGTTTSYNTASVTFAVSANVSCTPSFIARYTITVSAGSNGTISPSTATYDAGTSVAFTITPNSNYVIDSITIDSASSVAVTTSAGQSYTFTNLSADRSISATFIAVYTLTLTPTTTGGSVSSSPSGISSCTNTSAPCTATFNSGTSVTLTAAPSTNYIVNSWTGDCASSTNSNSCSLSMNSSKTVGISYSQTFTVTLGTLTNGTGSTINIASSPAVSDATITLTVEPASGKQLKSGTLIANSSSGNASLTNTSGNTYTFTMPSANVTVTAEFEEVPSGSYSVTINSSTGGSGTSTAATVSSGGSVEITAVPSSGYTFTSWTCTGGGTLSSTTTNPATLSNITSNASCTPNFTANAPTTAPRNNPPANNVGSKKIVVTRVSNQLNAQVSNNQKPVFVGTNSTFTPGNSVNQTQTVVNSTSATTSNTGGIVAVVTNTTQSPEAASNSAVVSAANTTAQTEVSRNSNVPAAVSVNRDENSGKIAVTATNGWTGRLSVAVVDNSSGEAVESYVEVVIAPTPAVTPQINLNPPANPFLPPAPTTPNRPTLNTGITINWQPSTSEVTGYIVTVNEKVACVSSTTSCVINQIVGPKSKVEVFAQGNDNTFSPPVVVPEFKPAAPIPGLVVYFPLASSRLTRAEVKKLDEFVAAMKVAGLNRVELQGHTDIQGTAKGYDNQTLSKNRANVVANYLRKNLKVITRKDQFADTKPAVLGTGEPVFQNNRRTEVLVW